MRSYVMMAAGLALRVGFALVLSCALLAAERPARAQSPAGAVVAPADDDQFTADELQQRVAPIARYADPLIGYPAVHGETGIMTFLVSHNGTAYERDLGPQTSARALAIRAFDPGPGWRALPE